VGLTAGTRLGPYEIVAQIGVGGMGEVWCATDTNLGRQVAIKVLPDSFAQDPDRLARFEREAKTLASLNHPNIAIIHGLEKADGIRALVMELVDGPTLADRIARGPIPIDEALPIAKQIAEALEAAHEQRIVHRDLKPANIKGRDGTVKVLDFGLAKAMEPVGTTSSGRSQSPTITTPAMTQAGIILGTAAYMSPEQARGRPADRRSDIWAFGCVLFEMLTGRRAFAGESVSDTIAAVLRGDPDWTAVPPGVPDAIDRLLRRCLERDSKKRLRDIGDARLELDEATQPAVSRPTTLHDVPFPWRRAVMAGVLVLALGGIAGWTLRRLLPAAQSNAPALRLSVVQPESTVFTSDAPQISPDGRVLTFVATDDSGRDFLYVRPLDSPAGRPLAGTEGATMPFWSPDSKSIGFFAQGRLKTVTLDGGDPQTLATVTLPRGATWNRDGTILFAPTPLGLFRVVANGGAAEAVPGTIRRVFPSFLPDGRHYLYLAIANGVGQSVHVGSLDGKDSTELVRTAASAIYAFPGYLIYRRGTALTAQRFDTKALALTGPPTPLGESVAINLPAQALVSASQNGVLVYFDRLNRSVLSWVDRQGRSLGVVGPPAYYDGLCLSRDDTRVVYAEADLASGNIDLRTLDFGRGVPVPLTFDPSFDLFPICSVGPAHDATLFMSLRKGIANVFVQPANAPSQEKIQYESGVPSIPTHWSTDGRWIVFTKLDATTRADVWTVRFDSPHEARPYVATAANERSGQLSPDVRWLAYVSDELGSPEIFVQSFPSPGARWQISNGGGQQPQWRRDGKELFYLSLDNRLMVVEVTPGGGDFTFGPPRALFATNVTALERESQGMQYAVSRDGMRFLLNGRIETLVPITVVSDWVAGAVASQP
jgi:eukaryotic-like serine/threonine-protein kinase